ncbi:hypothetical protein B7C62_15090 [Kitasatospora albolonga]|uniref:Uncharacterized protein n=1 Tax=Kitasatospora albolonga TaxID=68173 RepID=A0ABC8BUM6_9ACTN|nr:hypothetical protein B7C62_15090 [Kitasatospora albolonga]
MRRTTRAYADGAALRELLPRIVEPPNRFGSQREPGPRDRHPNGTQGGPGTSQGPDPISRIRPLTWSYSCRGGGI